MASTVGRRWSRPGASLAALTLSSLGLYALLRGWLPAEAGLLLFAPWLATLPAAGAWRAGVSGLLMGMAYIVPGRWETFAAAVAARGDVGVAATLYTLVFFACFALPFVLFAVLDRAMNQRWCPGPTLRAALRAGLLAGLLCVSQAPFPYTPLALVADAGWLLQAAAIGGEPLALALMLWPSAALAEVLAGSGLPIRQRARPLLPALVALCCALILGQWRLAWIDQAERDERGVTVHVGALQLDLPLLASAALVYRDQPGRGRSAVEMSRDLVQRAPACEILLWPEIPVSPDQVMAACPRIGAAVAARGVPVLMQCYRASPEGPLWVTSEWFPTAGGPFAWHAKSALVPFYERPLLDPPLFATGTPGTVLSDAQGRRYLPALCYELHSRRHLRAGLKAGAQVVLHQASFSPFGRGHIDGWDLSMARIRAVEFGLPIVRSANRGRAAWIDAAGRVRHLGGAAGARADCLPVFAPAANGVVLPLLAGSESFLLLGLVLVAGRLGRSRDAARGDGLSRGIS